MGCTPASRYLTLFVLMLVPFVGHAADLLIHNVNGYTFTQQSDQPHRFNQLLIHNGRVVSTDDSVIESNITPSTPRLNGQGKTLLPGLIDAHGHVLGLGELLESVDLRASKSAREAVQRVAAFADKNPELPVIKGRGWNQEHWPQAQYPTASLLDSLHLDKPVVLARVDGHALWVNRQALALAGIDENTPNPAGGQIVRDSQGQATGVLIDTAMNLVKDKLPPADKASVRRQLSKAYEHLLALGITSVHDAGIDETTEVVYREQARAHVIPMRIYAMLSGNRPDLAKRLQQGKVHNHHLYIQSVKIYADGALGSRGATLLADYADQPGNQGLAINDQAALERQFALAQQYGFQIAVHAIGDRANREVLNAFEKLGSPRKNARARHRIEHAQIIAPQDLKRVQQLGLIASMQPTHATSDREMAIKRLGANRLDGAYAWASLLSEGTRMAYGSDFPVEPANPFYGIHAAVTRQDRNNQPVNGWRMQDAVDVATAIRLFTRDAAYAGFWEKEIGTLEPGKRADFILLDTNPFTTLPDYLWKINVEQTWVGGKPVWKKTQ